MHGLGVCRGEGCNDALPIFASCRVNWCQVSLGSMNGISRTLPSIHATERATSISIRRQGNSAEFVPVITYACMHTF